ncbi:hypothetical protein MLK23_26365, partial [Escherichia coli]|nr:hypothetical protein [Escherichia coli]
MTGYKDHNRTAFF